jgi:hypothetical protein
VPLLQHVYNPKQRLAILLANRWSNLLTVSQLLVGFVSFTFVRYSNNY